MTPEQERCLKGFYLGERFSNTIETLLQDRDDLCRAAQHFLKRDERNGYHFTNFALGDCNAQNLVKTILHSQMTVYDVYKLLVHIGQTKEAIDIANDTLTRNHVELLHSGFPKRKIQFTDRQIHAMKKYFFSPMDADRFVLYEVLSDRDLCLKARDYLINICGNKKIATIKPEECNSQNLLRAAVSCPIYDIVQMLCHIGFETTATALANDVLAFLEVETLHTEPIKVEEKAKTVSELIKSKKFLQFCNICLRMSVEWTAVAKEFQSEFVDAAIAQTKEKIKSDPLTDPLQIFVQSLVNLDSQLAQRPEQHFFDLLKKSCDRDIADIAAKCFPN